MMAIFFFERFPLLQARHHIVSKIILGDILIRMFTIVKNPG
ncbi:hypothetical protein NUZ5A_20133 [Candidatus Nitrosotenuis uzonensis]|uniref:Uncharacterized protein n=1 Tax=Candidatus Nitrosotenuis uzonensis TaxID=1407055 RepID=A0A812F224_9ARCH|nr:hypothetical protein NUZ5A_20133 [Candidatus Nitrosotenuis uzonensis]